MLKSEYDTVLRMFGDLRGYVEYEHGVKARPEHGIWARGTEYGFITSGPETSHDRAPPMHTNIPNFGIQRVITFPRLR